MKHYYVVYRRWTTDTCRFGSVPLWLTFRCLPVIVIAGLLLLLLSTAPAQAREEQSQPNELGPNGVLGPQLLLHDSTGGHYSPAVLQSSQVHFDINGLVATVQVEQSFQNTTETYVEGVYAFPLPETAAVRALDMVVGERRIVGKIREKAQAKKIYEAAKTAGKKASLVEQQRPNLFINRVANIGPNEVVTVKMEYVQAVEFDASTFSLRFPMTITPRYIPGQVVGLTASGGDIETAALRVDHALGWAHPTDEVPDANGISPLLNPRVGRDHSPLNPVEITATLDMGMPLASVDSPYHDIALARRAGVYQISLANGVSEMDRDFVLQWQPVTGSAPQAALFTQKFQEQYYGLLMVVPPSLESVADSMPREIIFVVDTSGSMGGVSIEQARASVSDALQQLRPQDYFNIIEFNSHYRSLYRTAMPATRHHVQKATAFVRSLDASGGTEMLPALRAALHPAAASDLYREQAGLRQVIFITDGAVGNEAALFAALSTMLGESRLFTVGIGSAPNSWFMRKAAEFGRGTHTHIGDVSEVGDKVAQLFQQLSRPAAVNLSVQWPSVVEAFPQRIPDLYQGQPLSLAVSFGPKEPQGEVLVSAEINGRPWRRRLQLTPATSGDGHSGVGSVWARRKIEGLMDEKVSGRDEEAVRADVVPLALSHQLLSAYTSFVAVEDVVSRPAGASAKATSVLGTRPKGQTDQHFAYPQTATTGPAKAWFGVLCLFLGLMVRTLRQPEADGRVTHED